MQDGDSIVDQNISDPRVFLHETLLSSGREDLFRWADRHRLSASILELVVQLSLQEGATIENTSGLEATSVVDARALLPGTRVHIHIRKAAWASLSATLPIVIAVISIVFGDHSAHADIAAAFVSIARAIPETFHLLNDSQRRIYLAVAALAKKGDGATIAQIGSTVSLLKHQLPGTDVDLARDLNVMVQKGILTQEGESYKTT
jgi:hypothetical protein